MARQIKLEQIDDLMKEAVQELIQKTTLQWTALTTFSFHTKVALRTVSFTCFSKCSPIPESLISLAIITSK